MLCTNRNQHFYASFQLFNLSDFCGGFSDYDQAEIETNALSSYVRQECILRLDSVSERMASHQMGRFVIAHERRIKRLKELIN